jgi:signal transduction histidine kinase
MIFLVKDILDFAQIEQRSLIINSEIVDLKKLITECLAALSFKAEEKGIDLRLCTNLNSSAT